MTPKTVEVPPSWEAAFEARGLLSPGALERDGRWHPSDTVDDDPGEGNGRYCVPVDEPFVVFYTNWKDGLPCEAWRGRGNGRARKIPPEELAAMQAEADRARAERQTKAARAVCTIWGHADPAPPDHPYLLEKGIRPHDGLRVKALQPNKGWLCIPLQTADGEQVGMQYIASEPDAEGKFPRQYHPGALRRGTFCAFGPWPPKDTIVEVEGAATGISVHESLPGCTVVAAMDAGNLLPAAEALRKKYQKVRFTFFADNDASRVGITKAIKAAEAVDGFVCMSQTEGDDANDVYRREGPGAVKALLASAKKVGEWTTEQPGGRDTPSASVGMGVDGVRPAHSLATHLSTRRADTIEMKPIVWLWPDRLPLGKLVVIAGEPGTAKSRLSLSIAAVLSNGGAWPARTGHCQPGETLVASFEDDPADTSVPRLVAEGATLKRIHFLDGVILEGGKRRPFNATEDIPRLEAYLAAHPVVRLVVIDPISACLGSIDSHNNAEVRGALAPLAEMAARFSVCVTAITHLSKGNGTMKALNRVMASVAFTAAARVVHLVTKDPDDPERQLFLPIKSNLGQDRTGLAFGSDTVQLPGGIDTVRILWHPEPVTMTADEAIAPEQVDRGAMDEAKDFLSEILANGPVPMMEVVKEATEGGVKPTTLKRAKFALRVKAFKQGMRGGWIWALPVDGSSDEGSQKSEKKATPLIDDPLRGGKARKPYTGEVSSEEGQGPPSWPSSRTSSKGVIPPKEVKNGVILVARNPSKEEEEGQRSRRRPTRAGDPPGRQKGGGKKTGGNHESKHRNDG